MCPAPVPWSLQPAPAAAAAALCAQVCGPPPPGDAAGLPLPPSDQHGNEPLISGYCRSRPRGTSVSRSRAPPPIARAPGRIATPRRRTGSAPTQPPALPAGRCVGDEPRDAPGRPVSRRQPASSSRRANKPLAGRIDIRYSLRTARRPGRNRAARSAILRLFIGRILDGFKCVIRKRIPRVSSGQSGAGAELMTVG